MRLVTCPLSRLTATAPPKGEPSLASPLGGRWCPVGTVQRLTEPAGESGLALARTERASCQRPPRMGCVEALARVSCLWHDGEGSVKPSSRCPTGRERRFAVSLASFQADAHKVKGKVVGLCPTPRNPLKRVDLNFTWLPFLLSFFPQHVQCLHQLLLLHPAQLRGFHRLLQVLLHPPQLLFL